MLGIVAHQGLLVWAIGSIRCARFLKASRLLKFAGVILDKARLEASDVVFWGLGLRLQRTFGWFDNT